MFYDKVEKYLFLQLGIQQPLDLAIYSAAIINPITSE